MVEINSTWLHARHGTEEKGINLYKGGNGMFCSKCGKELPNDAVFCSGCGAKVGAEAAVEEVVTEAVVEETVETVEAEPVKEEAQAETEADESAAGATNASKTVTVSVDLSKFEKRYFTGNVNFAEFGSASFWNQCLENAKHNMIALICCAVMFINVFLPYGMVNFFGLHSYSLLSAGGGIFILLAVGGAVLACFRMSIPMLGVGCLATLVALIKAITFFVNGSGVTIPSIGFFLMIISAAGLAGAPFITKYVLKKD